jgi:hypothetical protein
MRYGYFDDLQREYVITQPDTPLPWLNYLGCEDYFGLISNTAGGYAFYRDARLRRLTRYRYRPPGNQPNPPWKITLAVMVRVIPLLPPPMLKLKPKSVILCRWARLWKSGSCR